MQLTRHADYALRVILDLASHRSSRIGDIARRTAAPPAFLAKVVRTLVKAGLVKSLRGRKGGITLTRPPSRITMLQVIEAVNGPLTVNRCVPGGDDCPIGRHCPARPFWVKFQKMVVRELRMTTVQSLLRSQGKTRLKKGRLPC